MNRRKVFTLVAAGLLVHIILMKTLLSDSKNFAVAAGSTYNNFSTRNQILPTPTPRFSGGEEALTTNPVLLQIIIMLSIAAVLVIFWGVWINRRNLDLR